MTVSEIIRDSDAAIERAISLSVPNSVICVTGSLYLIGEVREWLADRYERTGKFS